MIKYLDEKLAKNGAAQKAIADKDARSVMAYALEALVGVREATGRNDGPLVDLIQDTIGDSGIEPWCMSFIQTGIGYAEIKTGITSPVFASEHCMTVWNKTPKKQRVKIAPLKGAICIWVKGKGPSGHTGMVIEFGHRKGRMRLVEGNTNSGLNKDGSIEREGGGVYMTERSTSRDGSMRVVGFLKPF
jgi:hypothetical protein